MSIELLWLVPLIAAAFGGFLVLLLSQRKEGQSSSRKSLDEPHTFHDARDFDGETRTGDAQENRRIGAIEGRLERLTAELSHQKETVQKFQQENASYYNEINDLRNKLKGLHKEYDIVISENFSLRARVKKLKREVEGSVGTPGTIAPVQSGREVYSGADEESDQVTMRLFGDTRKMEIIDLEDTGEIDVGKLH